MKNFLIYFIFGWTIFLVACSHYENKALQGYIEDDYTQTSVSGNLINPNQIASLYDDGRIARRPLSEIQWDLQPQRVDASVKELLLDTVEDEHIYGYPKALIANTYVIFYIAEPLRHQYKIGDNIMFSCEGSTERFPARINSISSQSDYHLPEIFTRKGATVFRVSAALPEWVTQRVYPGQRVGIYIRKEKNPYGNNILGGFSQTLLGYFHQKSNTH